MLTTKDTGSLRCEGTQLVAGCRICFDKQIRGRIILRDAEGQLILNNGNEGFTVAGLEPHQYEAIAHLIASVSNLMLANYVALESDNALFFILKDTC